MKKFLLAFVMLVLLSAPSFASGIISSNAYSFIPKTAFYISTTGSDSNAGTAAAPFATLSKAQTAMQGGSTKLTYIRAGSYTLPQVVPAGQFPSGVTRTGLYLTSSDNGETFSYYPPDGYNTAVLDGSSSGICQSSSAIDYGIWIEGGSNITINGLKFQHFTFAGVNVHGGSSFFGNWETITSAGTADSDLIENNIMDTIYNGNPTASGQCTNPAWPPPLSQTNAFGGGVGVAGQVTNLTVTHNAITNIYGPGMDIENFSSTDTTAHLTISNNFFYNTMIQEHDSGCIHDYAGGQPSDTNPTTISTNYLRDCGGSDTSSPYGSSRGIYVDDSTSHVTVSGNIVAGHMSVCFNYHGGSNITDSGNICDLGDGALGNQRIATYQDDSFCSAGCMASNFFQNNIVISNASIAMGDYNVFLTGANALTSQNNLEHAYNHALSSDSLGGSASSSDPSLSGWTYNLAGGSAAYSSPVSFTTQPFNWGYPGFWGPPGFTIPHTGTVPSNPH